MFCSRHFQPRKGPNREIPSPWSRTCVWTFVFISSTGCSSAVFVNSPAAAAASIESRGKSGHKKQRCHSSRFSWSRNLHITTPTHHISGSGSRCGYKECTICWDVSACFSVRSKSIKNQRKTNTYLGKKGKIGQPDIRSDASNGRDDERWVDPTLYSLSRCHQHCHQLCCWTSAAPAFKSGIWYQTSVIFHFPVKLGIFVKSW